MALELEQLAPHTIREKVTIIRREIGKVIVGQDRVLDEVLIAIFAGGHVLLEGVPGLGKTRLVRTIGDVMDLSFSRVQFTPDLMPADITGTNILAEAPDGRRQFAFERGPIFANIVLADEINRATPKTQSSLLEAMQEGTVTVANQVHHLPQPFFVLATQNPVEMEGTYPLPEAQLDRFFFKVEVPFPSAEELATIVTRTVGSVSMSTSPVMSGLDVMQIAETARHVPLAHSVLDYAIRVVMATHPTDPGAPGLVKQYVRYGASPRGAQTVVMAARLRALLDGRANVAYDDIRAMAKPALRHRIVLNFDAEANDMSTNQIIDRLLESVPDSGL
jgi:MoxR-like ATPase